MATIRRKETKNEKKKSAVNKTLLWTEQINQLINPLWVKRKLRNGNVAFPLANFD